MVNDEVAIRIVTLSGLVESRYERLPARTIGLFHTEVISNNISFDSRNVTCSLT